VTEQNSLSEKSPAPAQTRTPFRKKFIRLALLVMGVIVIALAGVSYRADNKSGYFLGFVDQYLDNHLNNRLDARLSPFDKSILSIQQHLDMLENDHVKIKNDTKVISRDDQGKIQIMEDQLTNLSNQVETLKRGDNRYLKNDVTEKNRVESISETQNALVSLVLFWRLKQKINEMSPFSNELAAFRNTLTLPIDLSVLESFAISGLRPDSKEYVSVKANDAEPDENKPDSWCNSLKFGIGSFLNSIIKIQKIDSPVITPSGASRFSDDKHQIVIFLEKTEHLLENQLLHFSTAKESQPLPLKEQPS
jgi:hypothetical protein